MKTYFAPAERSDEKGLTDDVKAATVNPVIDGLLNTVSGLLAVLNEHRQILVINDAFMQMLGIDDAKEKIGLRPGEAISCVYSNVNEGGCGTSPYCTSCGAAIAMVACQRSNQAVQKECAIRINRNGTEKNLYLRVKACPITIQDSRMILLFLQDVTIQQQWEAVGRVFFHDLNNIIHGLLGSSEILLEEATEENRALVERIHRLSLRLAKEVQIQKHLTQQTDLDDQVLIQPLTVDLIFKEIETAFANHPAAKNRSIIFDQRYRSSRFNSDFFLVVRVLTNMVTNALEATDKGRSIKVWVRENAPRLSFYVWNHRPIEKMAVDRIFQRNISTKAGSGRGLGTYSMKLFGEKFLDGKIDFSTSESEGTTFGFHLPG